jgi:SNF2 family DNA or RNA helicase
MSSEVVTKDSIIESETEYLMGGQEEVMSEYDPNTNLVEEEVLEELSLVRPINISREGNHVRLVFSYNPKLVELVRELPYAAFDAESKSWTCIIYQETVKSLREWFYQGLCNQIIDDILDDDQELKNSPEAQLYSGTVRRPYKIRTGRRDDVLYSRLRAIPTASWDKKSQALTFGVPGAVALRELLEEGVLEDLENLLTRAETTIAFDARSGVFKIFGDERAQASFDQNFPQRDVMAAWSAKNLSVDFSDSFSEEVYRGELAKVNSEWQPKNLKLDLFEYQRKAVAVALCREGFGVYDSPGLGKTAVGIAWGNQLLEDLPRVVVVCPGAVRTQWKQEIQKFSNTVDSDIVVIEGSLKKRKEGYLLAEKAKWVIVHFDVLARDLAALTKLVSGSALIVDECHRIKNPTAKRSVALHSLGKLSARRLALTGTPVESMPDEFFNVLSFSSPGSLGGAQDFLNRYMYPNQWGGFEGARNLDELRERAKWHYMRHTKEQVAQFLPPLRVQHMVLDPDVAYTTALRRAHREARDEIARDRKNRATTKGTGILDGVILDELEAGSEMTAVGMLRALCTSPRLLQESSSPAAMALVEAGVIPDSDGPKLDELRNLAKELQQVGERVVIFTYSKIMANLIANRFEEDNVSYVLYTGSTSTKDREQAREDFTTEDSGITAFIATDAGSEGLNLGKHCSTLVNVDIPWTPSRLEQRSNRIHRIDGTAARYLVINMTLRGTIEEGILKMVAAKADLADSIFGEYGYRARTTGTSRSYVSIESILNSHEC